MSSITAPVAGSLTPRQSRRRRTRFWVDFFLVLVMVVTMAWSLQAARWTAGLERLLPVVLVAVVAGTLVARSELGRGFATIYSVVVGTAVVLYSSSVLASTELSSQERVYHVLERVYLWVYQALTDQPVQDNLVFVLLLAILMWVIAYSAAWTYFRDGRKWQAVLPIGIAMLVNLYYAPSSLRVYFIVYLLCAILLLVRATLTEREREWSRTRVQFPLDISFDFTRDALIFAVFVIFVSWVLPSAASGGQTTSLLAPLEQPWQQFQREWSRLFSTISYGRAVGTPVFSTSLSLGGPRDVTDAPVMDVRTPLNRYYRAVVVDEYNSAGWTLSQSMGIHLEEVDTVIPPNWAARTEISQTVTTYQSGNVLVGAPLPVWPMIQADARVLPYSDSEDEKDDSQPLEAELAMIVSRDSLSEGDSYTVISSIASPSVIDLQNDSTDYPDFIQERYLQLPDTIPQRVFDLAEEVTAGRDNPYDIARQLESFLRGYAYDDQIPGPAPGQDAVDYFLFEELRGYCNYYASSMAVMLRHLGIPARLAIGYATGEYLPDADVYRVRENDSHTWVEVYFPTYGWIEFEPTASEPLIVRPSGSSAENEGQPLSGFLPEQNSPESDADTLFSEQGPGDLPDLPEPESSTLPQTGGALLLVLSAVGIIALVIWSTRQFRRPSSTKRPVFRTVPQGFAVRLWEKLMVWVRRFGLSEDPSLTPLEQAGALMTLTPDAADGIGAIADLYVRDRYSPYEISTDEASDAQLSWLNLRPVLWRYWMQQRSRLPSGFRRAIFRSD
ncbi:MAG: transglutaminase domain-containing protein [Caldilineales bacterium]|nr:transglutaminase domain-containing protein [Caldilineales bacterium]